MKFKKLCGNFLISTESRFTRTFLSFNGMAFSLTPVSTHLSKQNAVNWRSRTADAFKKIPGGSTWPDIISSGSATPGSVLSKCSEEFKEIFMNADMIISKGQGNYEGMSDEVREIFFLLKVKCEVLARDIGVPINSLVLMESGLS